ncbi:MAG: hypothetical protein AABY22_10955 [Nanoarchaeota archaeon]
MKTEKLYFKNIFGCTLKKGNQLEVGDKVWGKVSRKWCIVTRSDVQYYGYWFPDWEYNVKRY